MIHDAQIYISPESYSPAFVAWYKFAMPTLGRRSSHILTVSEYSKRMLVEHRVAPADKVSVIHNGVDHILRIKADHDIVERLQLAPNGFVLALANTQKHKNIDVLFQAFTDNNLADLKLVLVGSASRADFEAKGISVPANAVFAGRVSDSELSGLMERALCFAFPSLTEGFGLPPLEAMLLGCPTVIAPCGALPEVCGSAALQADATNPRSWADAIHRLSVDPALRAQFSALGQAQAKQFVWSESAARLRRLLDQL